MRVVVVGGVAGGMSAAARLRRRDESAEIIVLERSKYVSFANCGLPYYVGGEIEDPAKLLLHTPQTLKAALNLDVRINSEVTAINPRARSVQVTDTETGEAYTLTYDHLILSPGALASQPPIDGLDSPRVHTLRTVDDALALREASGTRAVVLGAGFIGIEATEALAQRGFETHLVEYAEHVLPPLEVEMATLVTHELRGLGVCVHAGVAAQTITHGDDHDSVTLSDGTVLTADVIVLSTGVRPDTAFAEAAGIEVSVDDKQTWDARLAALAASGGLGLRVRVLGPREESAQDRWVHACRVSAGSPDIALYTCAVTTCPHAELLPFLREQAVSLTNHRFGTPLDLAAGLL